MVLLLREDLLPCHTFSLICKFFYENVRNRGLDVYFSKKDKPDKLGKLEFIISVKGSPLLLPQSIRGYIAVSRFVPAFWALIKDHKSIIHPP